ncbi:MAG TPA: Tol-Pal system protein TolB [Sphingomicrobium sp.]|nr:Tol-Pal system protein TolB [Sphingomicrobium sp.]
MGGKIQRHHDSRISGKAWLAAFACASLATAAQAQQPVPVIAVPPLTTPDDKPAGNGTTTLGIAWQASQLIAGDLRSTAEVLALPPDRKDYYSYPEVTAPSFPRWRSLGAKALLTGFIQARPDGRIAVGCYVYDVDKGRELGRIGFVAEPEQWRRAAHKCSGLAYQTLVGAPGVFDTRIAYVAKSGKGDSEVARIAVMDSDGYNHDYVTPGGTMVLTPSLSPTGDRVAFVSFMGGKPQVRVAELPSGEQRPILPNAAGMSFAPRFSPDGQWIVFSMQVGLNTDVYVAPASGGPARRLTLSPGADIDASFSPDGRRILFESDRSGSQQLYVMDADGARQRRVSFGAGAHAAPEWSPDGEKLAFTLRGGGVLRVGVMDADGRDERILTSGPRDESPSWGASSRELLFQRTDAAQRTYIYRLPIGGGTPRKIQTPQEAVDPDWSGARD